MRWEYTHLRVASEQQSLRSLQDPSQKHIPVGTLTLQSSSPLIIQLTLLASKQLLAAVLTQHEFYSSADKQSILVHGYLSLTFHVSLLF